MNLLDPQSTMVYVSKTKRPKQHYYRDNVYFKQSLPTQNRLAVDIRIKGNM